MRRGLTDLHMMALAALRAGAVATAEEIAARLGVQVPVARRLLRDLEAAGLVRLAVEQ